ncbi:uncharacterized protein [Rutidosis leptorrhynchoides]|uniref:uncharacterized protein n=1 Tax=Rutidosis leptorrhynchoides TaxID=125765 RepID=UPI003A9A4CBD
MAKIADFGLSKLRDANQQGSTVVTDHVAGTSLYLDPEYNKTGKLKKASDIYSFGVVLFELLCGRLAYDSIYYANNRTGLPSVIVGQSFDMERLKKMVDPKIMEADANILKITGGVNQDSLETFITIAYKCLAETQAQRPLMEFVIKELEKSLEYQKSSKDNFQMSFNEIISATKNFSEYNCLGSGRCWKLYEGKAFGDDGCSTILVKRWNNKYDPKHHNEFLTELEVFFKYKQESIIGLGGYCNEMDEKIIVYEHGYNRRLNKHLDDVNLTWTKRLKIGIDVAKGLDSLHTGCAKKNHVMIHRDIKSASILLNSDFRAKIANLELCIKFWEYEKVESYKGDHAYSSVGYNDPQINGYLDKDSDIYSLGVVLIEMMCGRLAFAKRHKQSLGPLSKLHYVEKGNLDAMIFEGIKEQIMSESLITFQAIALQCLNSDGKTRPSANEVVVQLNKALEFQEDIEIWGLKLPKDYKEIIKMSTTPDIYSTKTRKELYQIFHKGILLQQGKLWFFLSDNEERNEIVSARMFSYKNHKLHKWRSVHKSRFQRVVKMFDVSHLNIQIKIKPQFLSQNVIYGASLVFKYYDPRIISFQPMYVNLKYKMGGKTLNAYFATWRKDEWMMIELSRFLYDDKYTDFEVQLDSFSRCYCLSGAIIIEGIEFRAINDVSFKLFAQSEAKLKKSHTLPAKKVLLDSADVKCFTWKSLSESRFTEVAELLSNQVFRIKCKFENQALSPNTTYTCYLIFTLAEKCQGLQCPVRIRDVLLVKNKETKFVYFRTPTSVNLHDITKIPQQRDDGLSEVIVWEFNSNKVKGDHIPMHLKLISYEGNMRGLNVYGIEFRPV